MMAVICGTPMPATTRVVHDAPGPHANLDGVDADGHEVLRGLPRGDVADDERHFREAGANLLGQPDDTLGVAVGRVEHDGVGALRGQVLHALEGVARHADGRRHAEAAVAVLGRVRVLQLLLDVLDRDEPLQMVLVVDHRELFHAMPVQDGTGVLERGAHRHGDELFLRHDVGDAHRARVVHEAQVAVRQDAHEHVVGSGDRHAGDVELLHQFQRVRQLGVGLQRDGIHDHAALGALDLVDFLALAGDREVLVDDAQASLTRHGDGQLGLRDGVHGGRDDGDVEREIARPDGAHIDVLGVDAGTARQEQDVVERQPLAHDLLRRGHEAPGRRLACAHVRPTPRLPCPSGRRDSGRWI